MRRKRTGKKKLGAVKKNEKKTLSQLLKQLTSVPQGLKAAAMVERGGGVSGQYPSSGAPLACCCAEVAGEGGAGRREGAAAGASAAASGARGASVTGSGSGAGVACRRAPRDP